MATAEQVMFVLQLAAGVVGWKNVHQLYRDKKVRGSFWQGTLVFVVISVWNVFYMLSLCQYLSMAGAVVLAASRLTWIWLAFKYRRN